MIELGYGDERLAALYDPSNTWGRSDEFYLRLVMAAPSVLDAGCGTGELLCRARQAGHTGELVGVDPTPAMLAIAGAKRADIGWLHGHAQTMAVDRTFDLITMTGHAFQELLGEADTRAALANFHRHLAPGGRLAFESRNPAARAWERWTPELSRSMGRTPAGDEYQVWYEVTGHRAPDLVDFVCWLTSKATGQTFTCASTLRFIDPDHLHTLLTEAGFRVDGWYGDWDGSPFDAGTAAGAPDVIAVATRP